jgi:hypothetical protein
MEILLKELTLTFLLSPELNRKERQELKRRMRQIKGLEQILDILK